VVAFSLLMVEGYCALTLPVQGWMFPCVVAAALFALYALAMSVNLLRGRSDVDCGCGGPYAARQTISWSLVIRNLVLTVVALTGGLPVVSRGLTLEDIGTIVCATVAIAFVYASIEQAMANRQRQRHYFALRDTTSTGASS